MTNADKNFLGIKNKQHTKNSSLSQNCDGMKASSPVPKKAESVWSSLTEDQKKGLALLGISPGFLSKEGVLSN